LQYSRIAPSSNEPGAAGAVGTPAAAAPALPLHITGTRRTRLIPKDSLCAAEVPAATSNNPVVIFPILPTMMSDAFPKTRLKNSKASLGGGG